jgi:hypothetical protein
MRTWGFEVSFTLGLRVAQTRARRYISSWLEGQESPEALEKAQARRVRGIVERATGKNVIDLEDHREARLND